MPVGKKIIDLAKLWAPTAVTYGATAGAGVLYFTDWKLVLQYLPIYNAKFKED